MLGSFIMDICQFYKSIMCGWVRSDICPNLSSASWLLTLLYLWFSMNQSREKAEMLAEAVNFTEEEIRRWAEFEEQSFWKAAPHVGMTGILWSFHRKSQPWDMPKAQTPAFESLLYWYSHEAFPRRPGVFGGRSDSLVYPPASWKPASTKGIWGKYATQTGTCSTARFAKDIGRCSSASLPLPTRCQ